MCKNIELKEFKEYEDFIFLRLGEVHDGLKTIIYMKIFEDIEKKIYLGSLRFGVYHDYNNEELENCISYILNLKFAKHSAYEREVTRF